MNGVTQAQKIIKDLEPQWIAREARATLVIDWCERNGVEVASIMPRHLAAAMSKQKHWLQGPDDYLDMVASLVAFLGAR